MLHYVRHNNDVIIDVKAFWHPLLLLSWRKRGTVVLKSSYFRYLVFLRILYYWERLPLEYMLTCVYYFPYTVSVWTRPESCLVPVIRVKLADRWPC